mmetsp:Transcript_5891/g.6335  ORF Transcript_5891/g.6335 Transcript_5891/m.6335 type:complete len:451 (+) Transcript_5891:89-1441(+)
MVLFWTTAATIATRMETMRNAEAGLIALARQFGNGDTNKDATNYKMDVFDTDIPSSVLPFDEVYKDDEDLLTMHAIRATDESKSQSQESRSKYPLVIVHGYMNGALYFYRNLIGLTSYYRTVYSVDLLGWGLSSRPSWTKLKDKTIETTESFFVESLEAWRSKNKIEKMNLAGHSMGGYLGVAYCEKYPDRVHRLLLLSPCGVPDPPTPEERAAQLSKFLTTYARTILFKLYIKFWEKGYTPGYVMRMLPESRGRQLVDGYVDHRLPAITDPEEQTILSEYMYTGSILPPSGEYCLGQLLGPGVMAHKPCLHCIPKLQVNHVSFLYGIKDWMDVQGGLDVQRMCRQQQQQQQGNDSNTNTTDGAVVVMVPEIDVYQVKDAGHLLMLENSKGFNAAVIIAGGGNRETIQDKSQLPICIDVDDNVDDKDSVPAIIDDAIHEGNHSHDDIQQQ